MEILDATYDAIMRDEVLRVNFYGRAREVAAENERLRIGIIDAIEMIADRTDHRDWVVLDRVKEFLESLTEKADKG